MSALSKRSLAIITRYKLCFYYFNLRNLKLNQYISQNCAKDEAHLAAGPLITLPDNLFIMISATIGLFLYHQKLNFYLKALLAPSSKGGLTAKT